MNFGEDIKSITYMKTNSADLIAEVKTNRRPIVITQNGEPQAVLQELSEFQQQRDLLLLLRLIALGEAEVKVGALVSQDTLFSKIEEKLKLDRK